MIYTDEIKGFDFMDIAVVESIDHQYVGTAGQ